MTTGSHSVALQSMVVSTAKKTTDRNNLHMKLITKLAEKSQL